MSIVQRVREVLARQGLPEASPDADGYVVEDDTEAAAIVRWGRGVPFRDVYSARVGGGGLTACQDALARVGFHTTLVPFANPRGAYIRVVDRP